MKNILKALCLNLAKTETLKEAIDLLKAAGYWHSEDHWFPYGQKTNNISIIYNQASDSVRSMVEKLTNPMDQLIILECLKRGIDPEGPDAPRTTKEGLERFYDIPNGDLSELSSSERTELALNIKLIRTGTKSNPNFIVTDKGTGQSARTMPNTILSLASDNKKRILFAQGLYNQGGSATLPYSGLTLIVSKQHSAAIKADDPSANKYCFTIVRLEPPRGNDRIERYSYLAMTADELFSFSSEELMIDFGSKQTRKYDENFSHGTFIKMFDYKIKPKRLSDSYINTKLNYKISSLLPKIALPVRICERIDSDFKGLHDQNINGLHYRLMNNAADNLESDPPFGELTIQKQKIPYQVFVFKKDANMENYKQNESVILSLNGQNMGELKNHIFDRKTLKNLKNLKKSVLILCDFSLLGNDFRHQIFAPSRDRLRKDTDFYMAFEDALISHISKDPYLRELSNRRFNEEMQDRTKDNRDLEDIILQVIKSDPTLNDILGSGSSKIKSPLRDIDKDKKNEFKGLPFPTFFESLKGFSKDHPKEVKIEDKSFMLKFKTDAENQYFHRPTDNGTFTLLKNGTPIFDHHSNLHDGNFILHVNDIEEHFNLKTNPNLRDVVRFQWIVNDPSRVDPFSGEFYVTAIKGKSKSGKSSKTPKSPEQLKLPNIKLVKRDGWNNDNGFDENSALYINGGGEKRIFYINLDNKYLLNEIRKKPDSELMLTKSWEIALALLGLTKISSYKKFKNTYDLESRIFEDMRDYCPILIPLVLRIAKLAAYQKAA